MTLRFAGTDIEVKVENIPTKEYTDEHGWRTVKAFQAVEAMEMDMPDGIVRIEKGGYIVFSKGRMQPIREDIFDVKYREV